jgi:hypothetical protein
MIEPKDKRTTAWKEWNNQQITFQEPDGLGDIVEKITKATGIKKVVETVAKAVDADCGCSKRKDSLNEYSKKFLDLFVSRRKPLRCLTTEMFDSYSAFIERRSLNLWQDEDVKLLINLYAHVFAIQYQNKDLCRNCGGTGKILFRMTEELDKVYKAYGE